MAELDIGDTAPTFELPDAHGEPMALADLLSSADKGLIVYFYPRAMTPGCTTEACDFRDSLGAWQAAGYNVVGVSPDPSSKLSEFTESESLPFPLLSDEDLDVAKSWGVWGTKNSYGKVSEGIRRSTVVLNPDGTVQWARYNVRSKGHVSMLRRELGVNE